MKRSYSHSALKQFKTCPRQFYEMRILKAWPREDTTQTLYGTELHLALELAIRDNVPLPAHLAFLQPVLDTVMSLPGEKYAELELAVNKELEPCPMDDPLAWMRGIIDLAIINGTSARIIDWKTGSNKYPDKDQLTLMALLLFAHYPAVQEVKSALLFVLKDDMVKHETPKNKAASLWSAFREDVAKVERCHETGVWHEKSSGLCKRYCAVLTCFYNGRN